jgi:hypothetical protein
VEVDAQDPARFEVVSDLPFNQSAIGNPPGARMILHAAAAAPAGRISPQRNGPLGHGIDFTVGAAQGNHQQRASVETLGIADGRDENIQLASNLDEGGQRCRDHHRGRIVRLEGFVLHGDSLPAEHVGQRLLGETVFHVVARPCQPHDKTIADQLVVPDTADAGNVLDPRSVGRCAGQQENDHDRPAEVSLFRVHIHPILMSCP